MQANTTHHAADATLTAPSDTSASLQRRTSSEALLRGESKLVIVHRGEEYYLRITRAGRLLLTK